MNSLVVLERDLDIQAEVLSLDVGEARELDVDVVEMETGDLLVEDLGEDVETCFSSLPLLANSTCFLVKASSLVL